MRSDTAGYQEELLLYCGEGKHPRFGVIDFATGADVTKAFRAALGISRNRRSRRRNSARRGPINCLAHNLNTMTKRQVLGKEWATKRMKALRLRLVGLPGRLVNQSRKLIIRLGASAEALGLIVSSRQTIRALACGPSG